VGGVHYRGVLLMHACVEPLPSGLVEIVVVVVERPLPRVRICCQLFEVRYRFAVLVADHMTDFVECDGEVSRVCDFPNADLFSTRVRAMQRQRLD
jgi:hypothetical protein